MLALLAVVALGEAGPAQERIDTLALEGHARFLAHDLALEIGRALAR